MKSCEGNASQGGQEPLDLVCGLVRSRVRELAIAV
jgi:hypothetical protein